jgi:hypothetical protein
MPEISRFLGIVIGMFYSEHGVPHFHAVYGEHEVSIEIDSRVVLGEFPPRDCGLCLNGLSCTGQNCWRTGNWRGKGNR